MLKELKEANVVDAGGKDLLFLMKGFLEVIKNPEMDISSVQKLLQRDPLKKQFTAKLYRK